MKRPTDNVMSEIKTRQKLAKNRNVWVIHEDFEPVLHKFILPVLMSAVVMRRSF